MKRSPQGLGGTPHTNTLAAEQHTDADRGAAEAALTRRGESTTELEKDTEVQNAPDEELGEGTVCGPNKPRAVLRERRVGTEGLALRARTSEPLSLPARDPPEPQGSRR